MKRAVSLLAAAVALVTTAPAWADVGPPNFQDCQKPGEQPGDLCDQQDDYGIPTGTQGLCTPSQCNDGHSYPWDSGPFDCPDGSTCTPYRNVTPPSVLVSTPYACMLCLVPDGGLPTADGGIGAPDSSDSGGCAIASGTAKLVGPWMLAGSVSLLLLLKRRRRTP
jgi:hypothetical protein